MDPGPTPNFAAHAGGVAQLALAPVELHHPAPDALAEVLVGRADQHLLDALVPARDVHARGEPVVGLLLLHRPHRDTKCGERVLEQGELGEEDRVHPVARLVPVVEVVAERLDHVVGGDGHVGGAVLEHHQHGADDAARRRDVRPRRVEVLGHREVVPEQLVGAVDEVHLHAGAPIERSPVNGTRSPVGDASATTAANASAARSRPSASRSAPIGRAPGRPRDHRPEEGGWVGHDEIVGQRVDLDVPPAVREQRA